MLTDLEDPTECRCIIDSHDVIAVIRSKKRRPSWLKRYSSGNLILF